MSIKGGAYSTNRDVNDSPQVTEAKRENRGSRDKGNKKTGFGQPTMALQHQ
jgi:hypothetical protein